MSGPNFWTVRSIFDHCREGPQTLIGSQWVPARPLGLGTIPSRLAAAWEVFTGRADVLRWPHLREGSLPEGRIPEGDEGPKALEPGAEGTRPEQSGESA